VYLDVLSGILKRREAVVKMAHGRRRTGNIYDTLTLEDAAFRPPSSSGGLFDSGNSSLFDSGSTNLYSSGDSVAPEVTFPQGCDRGGGGDGTDMEVDADMETITQFKLDIRNDYFASSSGEVESSSVVESSSAGGGAPNGSRSLRCRKCGTVEATTSKVKEKAFKCSQCVTLSSLMAFHGSDFSPPPPRSRPRSESKKRMRQPSLEHELHTERIRPTFPHNPALPHNPISMSLNAAPVVGGLSFLRSPFKKSAPPIPSPLSSSSSSPVHRGVLNQPKDSVIDSYFDASAEGNNRSGQVKRGSADPDSNLEGRLANLLKKAQNWDHHTRSAFAGESAGVQGSSSIQSLPQKVPQKRQPAVGPYAGSSSASPIPVHNLDNLGPFFSRLPSELSHRTLLFLRLAPDLVKLSATSRSFCAVALQPRLWKHVNFHKSCRVRSSKVTDDLVGALAARATKMESFIFEGPKSNPFASASLPSIPKQLRTKGHRMKSMTNGDTDGGGGHVSNGNHLQFNSGLLSGKCLCALAHNCTNLVTVRLILPGWGQQPGRVAVAASQQAVSEDGSASSLPEPGFPSINAESVAILLRQCTKLQKMLVGPGIKSLDTALTAERVPECLPTLKDLSFVQCHELVDGDVHALARRCPHLESFRAHPSPLLTNSSLSYIANFCWQGLKSVAMGSDLSNGVAQHSEISDPATLLARCPNLRQLRLSYCQVSLSTALRKVSVYTSRHHCRLDKLHLQYLNLRVDNGPVVVTEADTEQQVEDHNRSQDLSSASRSFVQPSRGSPPGMAGDVVAHKGRSQNPIYSTAPSSFALGGRRGRDNAAPSFYASGALRSLDLENCAVEDLSLKEVVKALPGLERLHIRSFKAFASTFPTLTAEGVAALAGLRSLVSLEIQVPTFSCEPEDTNADGVDTEMASSSVSASTVQLPLLHSCHSFDRLFQSCSRIRTLHFGFPTFLDEGVGCIARHCHMLETLKLTGCGITENIFRLLAEGVCRNLKGISLSGCSGVQNVGNALSPMAANVEPYFPLLQLVFLKDSGYVTRQDAVRVSRSVCGFVVAHTRPSPHKAHDGTWEVSASGNIRKWNTKSRV
jgi:hypothetical protein